MNNNKSPKSYASLSQQLSSIFDHIDDINSSLSRIEAYARRKYEEIEKEINPDSNDDVSKELRYHMAHFLHNLAKDYETKNRLFD